MFKITDCNKNLEELVEEALQRDGPTLFVVSNVRDVVSAAMAVALGKDLPYYYVPFATIRDFSELERVEGVVVVDLGADLLLHSTLQELSALRKPILVVAEKRT